MDSSAILAAFAVQWSHPDYPPVKVELADLHAAEASLGVHFPEDYKAAILSVGRPSPTLALLSAINDREVDLPDLSGFASPSEIVEETVGWREIGLPHNFVVIGYDCMGNMFCFDVADIQGDTVTTAPVYFWDHDFDTIKLVGASFPAWISAYCGAWSEGLKYDDF